MFDLKQDLVEQAALDEEIANLKMLQDEKRAEKKKKKEEIFAAEHVPDHVDDNEYLAELYGVATGAAEKENVVGFENM